MGRISWTISPEAPAARTGHAQPKNLHIVGMQPTVSARGDVLARRVVRPLRARRGRTLPNHQIRRTEPSKGWVGRRRRYMAVFLVTIANTVRHSLRGNDPKGTPDYMR